VVKLLLVLLALKLRVVQIVKVVIVDVMQTFLVTDIP
jgi:hypothetical protein